MRPGRTFVVVADGGALRVFEQLTPTAPLTELEALGQIAPEVPRPRDHAPRVHESVGPLRHGVEARTPPRFAAQEKFLGGAADVINAWAARGAFDSLIIFAAPRALGVLNARLDGEARKRLFAAVPKDLVKSDIAAIAAHVEQTRHPG